MNCNKLCYMIYYQLFYTTFNIFVVYSCFFFSLSGGGGGVGGCNGKRCLECAVHSQHVIMYEAVIIVECKISIICQLYDRENKFLFIWLDDDNDTNFEHDYHVELDLFCEIPLKPVVSITHRSYWLHYLNFMSIRFGLAPNIRFNFLCNVS